MKFIKYRENAILLLARMSRSTYVKIKLFVTYISLFIIILSINIDVKIYTRFVNQQYLRINAQNICICGFTQPLQMIDLLFEILFWSS